MNVSLFGETERMREIKNSFRVLKDIVDEIDCTGVDCDMCPYKIPVNDTRLEWYCLKQMIKYMVESE